MKELIHGKTIGYTTPTRFDHAPFGTLYIVLKNNENAPNDIYIQTSEINTKPVWECLGNFLDQSLRSLIEDDDFRLFCMKCYKKELNPDEMKLYLTQIKT